MGKRCMFKLGLGIAILLLLASYGCKSTMTKNSKPMEDNSSKPSKTDNNEFVDELKANFVYGMSKIAENLVKSDEKEVLLSNAQMQAMVAGVPIRFREFFCDVSKVKLEKLTTDGKSQLDFNMSFTNKIIGKEIVNGVYMTHDVSLYTSRDDQLKGIFNLQGIAPERNASHWVGDELFKNLSNNLFRVNRKNPEFIPPEEISYNPLQQKVMIGFEEIRGFSIQIRSIGFTGKKISNLPVYRISVDKSKEGQASIMATSISLETTEDSDFYESFFIGSLPDVKSWNHEKDKVFADHSSYVKRGQFIGKSGVDKFSFNYLDLTESSKNLPNIKDLGCR